MSAMGRHELLQMATIEIARFLTTNLPTNESDWWEKHVLASLTYQQQRNARERGFDKLQQLEFAALLQILDRNWFPLSEKGRLPREARSWVNELRVVRNKWAHMSAEPIPASETYRDTDTLGRLLVALGAAPETLQVLDKAKVAALAEMVGTGTTITVPAPMVWLPQQLNPLSEAEFDDFISGLDETWCAQELFRGKQLLIFKDADRVFAEENYGKRYEMPAPILDAVKQLSGDCIIDGVADKNIFYTYDLLKRSDEDCRPKPYGDRYKNLVSIVGTKNTGAVRIVPIVIGKPASYELHEELKKRNAEGIVYKDLCAKYEVGNKHQAQFKFKFHAECACIVLAHGANRSVDLILRKDDGSGEGLRMGSVTIPADEPMPEKGAVISVRYSHTYKGSELVEPVYNGPRADVLNKDCTIAKQKLKYKHNLTTQPPPTGGMTIAVKKTAKRKPSAASAAAFCAPVQPNEKLALVVGSKPLTRTELTKKLWQYIKKNGLQDKQVKTMINADAALQAVFGKKQVSMFEMTKLVLKNIVT